MASQTKVFIGNLTEDVTSDDLIELLSPYGYVTECDKVNMFAFAHFENPAHAEEACSSLNGKTYKGTRLTVQLSHSIPRVRAGAGRPNNQGMGPTGPECFHCGKRGHKANECFQKNQGTPVTPVVKTKVHVGNLVETITADDLRKLFSRFGIITECDKLGTYAFVHFAEADAAQQACYVMNKKEFKGCIISVQLSRSTMRSKPGLTVPYQQVRPHRHNNGPMQSGSGRGGGGGGGGYTGSRMKTKVHIGNIPAGVSSASLREILEPFGNVVECDVLSHYAFAHFEDPVAAQQACSKLNGFHLMGAQLQVQLSKSSVRPKPGMGHENICFNCGENGHWSKSCPKRDHNLESANGGMGHYPHQQHSGQPHQHLGQHRHLNQHDHLNQQQQLNQHEHLNQQQQQHINQQHLNQHFSQQHFNPQHFNQTHQPTQHHQAYSHGPSVDSMYRSADPSTAAHLSTAQAYGDNFAVSTAAHLNTAQAYGDNFAVAIAQQQAAVAQQQAVVAQQQAAARQQAAVAQPSPASAYMTSRYIQPAIDGIYSSGHPSAAHPSAVIPTSVHPTGTQLPYEESYTTSPDAYTAAYSHGDMSYHHFAPADPFTGSDPYSLAMAASSQSQLPASALDGMNAAEYYKRCKVEFEKHDYDGFQL